MEAELPTLVMGRLAVDSGDSLNREVVVQPDGMITLPLGGPSTGGKAARSGVTSEDLEKRFKKYFNVPSITVTPVQVNTRLEDLLDAVDARGGQVGGRQIASVVTPAGKIQLPGIGSVCVQGSHVGRGQDGNRRSLRSDHAGHECNGRSRAACSTVYLCVGPSRSARDNSTLTGPTTTMQATRFGRWLAERC